MVEGLPERTNSGLPVWEVRCSTLGCASSALVCECRFFNPGVVDQLYRIVSVAGVLLHHAIGVEVGAVERQSSAHQVTPLLGSLQVQRSDGFLQLLVERCGLFCIASTVFNGPSGDSFNATFYPPTIEDRQAWHAVQSRLHTACARGLIGTTRSIDPHVDTGSEQGTEIPRIVFEIYNAQNVIGERAGAFNDLPDERLARFILRMSLSGIENLEAARSGGDL